MSTLVGKALAALVIATVTPAVWVFERWTRWVYRNIEEDA